MGAPRTQWSPARSIRFETCLAQLAQIYEEILNRIVTCDEKWILFDNRKRSASWLDPGSAPKHCRKRKLTPRKVMVTVRCSSAGVINYSFLPNGMSINSDVYCNGLNTMMEKLVCLQQAVVNCSSPLLLHDNVRPHTVKHTVYKLQKLGLGALVNPPYSPDRAPTDTFQNLDNF
ncbi:unnamed protein product [Parnassius mnemosyne]|uniref:Transposase n=1 Tax=Parnassius mnemosyne TaxID=213953 RepID=A0AAV1KSZ0_9NEOP